MEYTHVKQQIIDGSFDKMYLFTGNETYCMHEYISKICEVAGMTMQLVDSVAQCVKSQANTLLSQPTCYVCQDDAEFMRAEDKWDNIEKLLCDNMLILILTAVDKRSKFYKKFFEKIVVFDYMHPVVLTKHIKERSNLNDEDCRELIDICESNYSRILSEVDKITRFAKINNISDTEGMTRLLDSGAIYIPPRDVIFEFVDAVLDGKPRKAFSLLYESIDYGNMTMTLLSVLYTSIKQVLQVQSCTKQDIEETTGLQYWQIRNAKKHLNVYTNGELVRGMKMIQFVESGIKSGKIDENKAMDYVLVNILM